MTVIDKVGKGSYRLKPFPSWKDRIHWVFHETLLKPYVTPKYKKQGRPDPPPPLEVDGEEEFEVEEVLGSRMYRRKLQYLVKWQGYGIEHNEWIPYQDMHSDRLIKEFHKKNPNAIRSIDVSPLETLYVADNFAQIRNLETLLKID